VEKGLTEFLNSAGRGDFGRMPIALTFEYWRPRINGRLRWAEWSAYDHRQKPRQARLLRVVTSWRTKVTTELRKRMPVGHLLAWFYG
jgi:ribonuclease D